jgi:hypothetical protein
LNVGVEYLYGSHEQKDGGKGTASRVQFAAKYDLYRKRPLSQKKQPTHGSILLLFFRRRPSAQNTTIGIRQDR